jgi:hypothetical protein
MHKPHTLHALLICLFVFLSINTNAQFTAAYQIKADAQREKLDLTGIKNGILINQSFFTPPEIDYYRQLHPGDKPNPTDSDTWLSVYQRIRQAQIKADRKKFPEVHTFVETERSSITKNNVIPIGIFDIEGTLLTEQQ